MNYRIVHLLFLSIAFLSILLGFSKAQSKWVKILYAVYFLPFIWLITNLFIYNIILGKGLLIFLFHVLFVIYGIYMLYSYKKLSLISKLFYILLTLYPIFRYTIKASSVIVIVDIILTTLAVLEFLLNRNRDEKYLVFAVMFNSLLHAKNCIVTVSSPES